MSYPEGSAEELFAYFGSFVNFEQKQKQTIREYRLDRMYQLLEFFGNPQKKLNIIHIAGSKGKGSTALFIARGIEALGFKAGLYTSPHISAYRERITRAGSFFEEEAYISVGAKIENSLKDFSSHKLAGDAVPTAFELFTLFAFLLFVHTGCRYAVIETGIGGRLDATNTVTPQASVITPIELEHTDILGDTIEKIAAEKAGIIKAGVPVFVSRQSDNALHVLEECAKKRGSRLYYLPEYADEFCAVVDEKGTHVKLTLPPLQTECIQLDLSMQGETQAENAALALSVLQRVFPEEFYSKLQPKILQALSMATLPGRMEVCYTKPPVVLDGAHTPTSVRRSVETFQKIYGKKGICIFGSVEGKNTEGMAAEITSAFSEIIISKPGTFKPNSPEEVARIFRQFDPASSLLIDAAQALQKAFEISAGTRPILVTGSFYMVAEIRPLLLSNQKSGIMEDV